jgi:serine/threonine protein kinase
LLPTGTDTADQLGIVRPSAPTIKMSSEGTFDFLAPAQQVDEMGRLGPYRILSVLGEGGMGVVFKADDPGLNRLVALKVMKPDKSANDVARERFKQEGRAAASLQHDNIVTIYAVSEDRGVTYLAMQFLQGESLDDCLKREGKLPAQEVIRITREVAEGLAVAHDRGLIHRDIKPANIWLEAVPSDQASPPEPLPQGKEGGRVKILDFGLARQIGENVLHLTQTGMVVGTPDYMAPEQARSGQVLDCRCDLFSLGSVMYRMCTGQKPFQGEDIMATLLALAMEDPPPPRFLNPQVPQELSDMIRWMMAKSPADRPRSARRVIDSLQVIQRNLMDGGRDLPESYPAAGNRRPPPGLPSTRKTGRRSTTQVPLVRESPRLPSRGSTTSTTPQEKVDNETRRHRDKEAKTDKETRKQRDKEAKPEHRQGKRLEELGLTPVGDSREGPAPRSSRSLTKQRPALFPATVPPSVPTSKPLTPAPETCGSPPKDEGRESRQPLPQKCPKCGHDRFSSLGWCVSCGYTPSLDKKEEPRSSKPISWLWGLFGGMSFVIFLTVACHWLLRASGLNWTRWVWMETGIGLAAFLISHVWNYYTVMPLYGDHTGRMSLNPVHLTACAFRMLPKTQWPICLGAWGLTAVVGVAIAVGDLSYFWKFKVKLPNPSSPFELVNWGQDKKSENGNEKVDLPKKKATATKKFYVVGYYPDGGKISKVVLASLEPDGKYQFVGDAPTTSEALAQRLSETSRRNQSVLDSPTLETFRGATWVEPFLWEVEYVKILDTGKLEGAVIK